ncbi:MAG TPA: hypothetical protein VKZ92_06225 [Pseudohongiella sp.]|nr:hypothetical protein [Pseudohongiella sp.]
MLLASYFACTVVAGIINNYSPVPFWDSWPGTLGFYLDHLQGRYSIWWAQHNEHRIVLARLLFWLDFKLASGSGILLLSSHLLLMMLAVYVFFLFSRRLLVLPAEQQKRADLICLSLLTIWLFRWIQSENIVWTFQSQFFMAQTIPLLALYLLARASVQPGRKRWFVAACVAGVAATGTMANGVITLPLMLVYLLLTRQSWQRLAVLLLLTVVMLALYFHNYWSPPSHGSVLTTIREQPVELAHYVLLYLGTPFFYLLNGSNASRLAVLASVFMAIVTFAVLFRCITGLWKNPEQSEQQKHDLMWKLALVLFIAYIAGTALGTGGGRLVFGLYQAVTLRYTTPALMAWAAVFLLLAPYIYRRWSTWRLGLLPLAVVVLLPMINKQADALIPQDGTRFERSLAALALELLIRDEERISAVYELSNPFLDLSERARRRQLSFFKDYPWQGLREQMYDFYRMQDDLPQCLGHVDSITAATPDNFLIQGWLVDPETHRAASRIRVVDANNITRGFAVGGAVRRDVVKAIGMKSARLSGFGGYVSASAEDGELRLLAEEYGCVLTAPSLATTGTM